jgi:hypothetical protein
MILRLLLEVQDSIQMFLTKCSIVGHNNKITPKMIDTFIDINSFDPYLNDVKYNCITDYTETE